MSDGDPYDGDLFNHAPCGYLLTDAAGTINAANATFAAMTGYSSESLIGRRFIDLLPVGDRLYHETNYAPLLQLQDHARTIAFEILCADGKRLPVLINSTVHRDLSGEIRGIRTAVLDASERREYERELIRAKQAAQEAQERAVAFAHTLQQTLIPPSLPEIPGLELASVYLPATGEGTEAGGDFYDVFQIAENDWAFALGDVMGKGTDAALVTALARYTLRAACVINPAPSRALEILNDVLLRDSTDRYCTVVLMRVRLHDGHWRATICCAGHPLPLLIRQDTATRVGQPGSMLAAFAEPELHDTALTLERGDNLLVYTDGLPDTWGHGELFGDDRLEDTVSRNGGRPQHLIDSLVAAVSAYSDRSARDDIAALALYLP